MVADLFADNRAAVEPALEGFAENWVEGLLHLEIEEVVAYAEGDGLFESLQRVGLFCGFFVE